MNQNGIAKILKQIQQHSTANIKIEESVVLRFGKVFNIRLSFRLDYQSKKCFSLKKLILLNSIRKCACVMGDKRKHCWSNSPSYNIQTSSIIQLLNDENASLLFRFIFVGSLFSPLHHSTHRIHINFVDCSYDRKYLSRIYVSFSTVKVRLHSNCSL